MANFTTHIAAGTVVAGALATLTLAANVVTPESLVAVTMAGVLGSVLPDIDLKDSRPSSAMFAGLGIFFSFAVLFTFAGRYSIAELWVIWLGTLVLVRYGLHAIFHRLAVHRGIWHSILAALFSAAATAIIFAYVLGKHEGVAWLAGGFMFVGYLVHLTLDEMYSVDVMDTRIKASFGTALKLYDRRHPYASASMAAALALALWVAPSPAAFWNGLSSRDLWAGLSQRMLPETAWFGLLKRAGIASAAAGTSKITTGALQESAPPTPPAAAPSSPAP
ncbi:MAG: metal-dependent hydrolase [Hyphomicrobium sp.]